MKVASTSLIILLAACSGVPSPAVTPAPQATLASGTAHYDLSAIDSAITSVMDERLTSECASGHFSGIVVVRVGDREVYSRSCGTADASTGEPITRDRRFKIYSINKLLTATAIMRLVELGAMSLDAPVARYIPDLPPAWHAVSVRHLLQHTSGVPDLTERLIEPFKTTHQGAMRTVLANATASGVQPTTAPGEKWQYNNFGYELLADAGATAAGKPFEQVLQERVFDPSGMRDAVVDRISHTDGKPHSTPDARLVKGYNGEPGNLVPVATYSFVQLGAGAVFATIDDLLAFDRAIREEKVLSRETWKLMTESRVQTIEGDTTRGWGLGMRLHELNGIRMQTHSGGVMGYISNFVRYPDQDAVLVVMTNRGFSRPGWMAEAVANVFQAGRASP